ncbi:MAG: hypothetical protein KDK70_05420 [Myxococcales bacterium]|nr:hypothetical protein [Myxococcales bacterium]
MRPLRALGRALRAEAYWASCLAMAAACGPEIVPTQGGTGSGTGTGTTAFDSGDPSVDESTAHELDVAEDDDDRPHCLIDGSCHAFDVVLVIDDSSTMSGELLDVSSHLPLLLDELMELQDPHGALIESSINLMVTTTDVGHPLCAREPGDAPRRGAPVHQGCNARIEHFTGPDPADPLAPLVLEEACTLGCPVDVVPDDPFIHFGTGTNVPVDDVYAALSCIGPQGFAGCDYRAPLEAMLQAIDPQACWNDPEQPACDEQAEWAEVTQGFLRDEAVLVIVIISDGMDCSVAPGGYSMFTGEDQTYWSIDPATGTPQASPAICVNAGVSCDDRDDDGIYESCTAVDGEVLHPVERYVSYLRELGKRVVMLGILGVPEVEQHDPNPPFEPVAGGVFDLVYRDWIDAPYPRGDILPDPWDAGRRADDERFERGGLAPGCMAPNGEGSLAQALPPVRVREVCEGLDFVDQEGDLQVRCCIESLCDPDFHQVMRCLYGLVMELPLE